VLRGYKSFEFSQVSYLFAEFDALTGSKIASIDLGARVVRMAYSPTTSHVVIAILEVCLIASLVFLSSEKVIPFIAILEVCLKVRQMLMILFTENQRSDDASFSLVGKAYSLALFI
jgi:hypothetical protein